MCCEEKVILRDGRVVDLCEAMRMAQEEAGSPHAALVVDKQKRIVSVARVLTPEEARAEAEEIASAVRFAEMIIGGEE